jgi:hypothetical protein
MLLTPQHLFVSPRFDYKDFIGDDHFSDCKISFHAKDAAANSFKASRVIVATTSSLCNSAFTGGMEEATTGLVPIRSSESGPAKVFPELAETIFNFLYTGRVDLPLSDGANTQLMRLYVMATEIGADLLVEGIKAWIQSPESASSEIILALVGECYSYDLVDGLEFLIDVIRANFKLFTTAQLSATLDVITFIKVINPPPGRREDDKQQGGVPKDVRGKFELLKEFLGDWRKYEDSQDTEDALRAIDALFPAEAHLSDIRRELNTLGLLPRGR